MSSGGGGGGHSSTHPGGSKLNTITPQLDEMTANFGMIVKDLKNVSTTLNLLARQIDQVVNKMDAKLNFIIENINSGHALNTTIAINDSHDKSQEMNGDDNAINGKTYSTGGSKKIIKVINNTNGGSKKCQSCDNSGDSGRTAPPLITSSHNIISQPTNQVNSVGNSLALNKSANALKKQTASLLTNLVSTNDGYNGGGARRALSDRKASGNLSENESNGLQQPTSFNTTSGAIDVKIYGTNPNGGVANPNANIGSKVAKVNNVWTEEVSDTNSNRSNAMTVSSNGTVSSTRMGNVGAGNTNSLSKVKCTRSKSQPAFKDGSYSFVSSSKFFQFLFN
jgi:hypothetical protein